MEEEFVLKESADLQQTCEENIVSLVLEIIKEILESDSSDI